MTHVPLHRRILSYAMLYGTLPLAIIAAYTATWYFRTSGWWIASLPYRIIDGTAFAVVGVMGILFFARFLETYRSQMNGTRVASASSFYAWASFATSIAAGWAFFRMRPWELMHYYALMRDAVFVLGLAPLAAFAFVHFMDSYTHGAITSWLSTERPSLEPTFAPATVTGHDLR